MPRPVVLPAVIGTVITVPGAPAVLGNATVTGGGEGLAVPVAVNVAVPVGPGENDISGGMLVFAVDVKPSLK